MKQFELLGVKIENTNFDKIIEKVEHTISSRQQLQIATVNNEFLLEARKNPDFKKVLKGSFCIPDSTGVVWGIKSIYQKKITKTPGADLFDLICQKASTEKWRIFLLGGGVGVGTGAKKKLEAKYPALVISGVLDGIFIDPYKKDEKILKAINDPGAQIVFVALGAPKQDLWIANNMKFLHSRIFVGVGGTLDYISGRISRAPNWMRKANLEWLYRMIIEPKRIGRILKAVFVFPVYVLGQKIFK